MFKCLLARALTVCGLTLAGALSAVAPAQAAVVVASFDPAFGAGIPNLGFKGTANLDIADTCFGNSGLILNGNAGCNMTVLSSEVQFYNLATPATVFGTVNFGGSSFFHFNVLAGFFSGGQLAGLDTQITSPKSASLIDDTGGPSPINFTGFLGLEFFTGLLTPADAPAANLGASTVGFVPGIGGARLVKCTNLDALGSEVPRCVPTNPDDISNPAALRFSTVPEPGTIALALLALGAAGTAGSRRARKAR